MSILSDELEKLRKLTIIGLFADDDLKENIEMLRNFFDIKKTPLGLIKKIQEPTIKEFHSASFSSVEDTVTNKDALLSFSFYYDYVINLISPLYEKID